MVAVVARQSERQNEWVDGRRDVLLETIALDGGVGNQERICASKVVVPGRVRVHMVLEVVFSEPALRWKSNCV